MLFDRKIYGELASWKDSPAGKPLLLMGARQTGKTTVLKSFGKREFGDLAYFNLEKRTDLHEFFQGNKSPKNILRNLSLVHGSAITPKRTLLVLDEIQECRDAVIALKYFQEEMPELHIIGAGSLLGLTMGNDRSFPVGKVEFLDMYPLSFAEYLAVADERSSEVFHHFLQAREPLSKIPEAFFTPLMNTFREYLLFGGMPEVAAGYLEDREVDKAQKLKSEILRAYQFDFVKHANSATTTKIQRVWSSLPSQLAKENKKFIYRAVRSGARAREYEEAIQWLIQAGLVYKVARIEKPALPIKAYEDLSAFKLYVFETGLLIRLAGLEPGKFISGDRLFTEFKGSLAENYVASSLQKTFGEPPHYWTSAGRAEIDFIVAHEGDAFPVEVKSGTNTRSKSLSVYQKKYRPKLRLRISNLNIEHRDDFLNIPVFYTDYLDKLIYRALQT